MGSQVEEEKELAKWKKRTDVVHDDDHQGFPTIANAFFEPSFQNADNESMAL